MEPTSPARSKLFPAWILVLLFTLFIISGAVMTRVNEGLAPTALTNLTPWGLWVAFYIYFIGLSAGAFLVSSLAYVFRIKQFEMMGRFAVLTAAICMSIAMLFILPDLGRMVDRWYYMIIYRQYSSLMQVEFNFYIVYIAILVAELFFLMRRDLVLKARASEGISHLFYRLLSLGSNDSGEEAQSRDTRYVRILGSVGIPVAVAVHGGTGAIFAVVKAKPLWFSPLMPVVFVTSALASGGALTLALYVMTSKLRGKELDHDLITAASRLVAFVLVLDWFFMFWEIFVPGYGQVPEELLVIRTMIYGPFSWVFWSLEVLVGLILPVVVLVASKFRKPWMTTGAMLLIAVGIFGVRLNIVIPAFFTSPYPILAGQGSIYFPTSMEWGVSTFLVVVATLLYSIGVKVLPMERVEAAEGDSGKGFSPRVDLARRLSLKKLGALVATASVASVITIGSAHREDPSATGVEGKRWAMVIDLTKCTGCQACVVACKTENNTPSGSFRRWVLDIEVGNYPNVRRLFVPLLCNQCESPPCIPVCPVDATWKRADGVVVVDWERCIGCRYCMVACPYGARDFDWKGTQMVDKCTFCAHRLENGLLPACVEQCPAEAMVFGDLNDANSEVSKIVRTRQVQVLKPELGTNPKVFYIGLPSTFEFESATPQPLGLNLPLLGGAQVPTTSVTVSEEAGTVLLGNKYLTDPRLSRQIVVSGERVEVEAGD